jgi:alpha/beta hydrolase family protein
MNHRKVLGRAGAILWIFGCLAIFTLMTAAAPQQTPAAAAVIPALIPPAPPNVIGPVRNTTLLKDPTHGYPFNATPLDFKKAGYVEEEFFIEGKANRFVTSATANATPYDGGNPYLTRIVVRRPATASKFNGTVIVEWTNVSQGHDHEADWFQAADYFMRNGYAWVGVSAQAVGVQALTQWSPARYGSLNVSGPAAGAAGGRGAGARGAGTPSPLSFDIFTQAGLVIRGRSNVNVMGGLKVERLIATGHSQSAGQLGIYFNSVHPLAAVYDAVVLHGGGGKMRSDLNVKIFKILSETDLFGLPGEAAFRQADTDKFREWEVAGASHLDATNSRGLASVGLLVAGATPVDGAESVKGPTISGGGAGIGTADKLPGVTNDGCQRPPLSRIPFKYVLASVYDHLVEWVNEGKAPPTALPIETANNAIVRDADGNAKGGIQLSQHAVPTAVNRGDNNQAAGSSAGQFCMLLGSYEPFSEAKLTLLYPKHDVYVKAVKDATDKSLRAGFILKPDADATVADANKANVGKK